MVRLLALLIFMSPLAQARLAPSQLDPLIRKSELIIEATPIKLEPDKATLKVLRVLHGTYSDPEIVIPFSKEVHDHVITQLGRDRLLFLKRSEDGSFRGTQYGRSYWELTSTVSDPQKADLDSPKRYFEVKYPITMVKFTAAQTKALIEKNQITMPKLKAYIAKIKAESPN